MSYAASRFRSIEINGTFLRPAAAAELRPLGGGDAGGFRLLGQGAALRHHVRRLAQVEGAVANFLASGVLRLGRKLGPILWQFPPGFAFDADRFESFFALLPHDTEAAAALARRHEARLDGAGLGRDRCEAAVAPCGRDPA